MAATTVKIFIDVFIGIWSFVLAMVWCTFIDCKPGERMKFSAVLDRFPGAEIVAVRDIETQDVAPPAPDSTDN